jgi:hypothetical protein
MADVPKWLEELRRQHSEKPMGTMAVLRQIVASGEAASVSGILVPRLVAERLLHLHDSLPPREQELFVAQCNRDFRGCATRCLTLEAMKPLADLLSGTQNFTDDADVALLALELRRAAQQGGPAKDADKE